MGMEEGYGAEVGHGDGGRIGGEVGHGDEGSLWGRGGA